MKELYKILWVESGWSKMTWKQRLVAVYFGLSMGMVLMCAESKWWILAIMCMNAALSGVIAKNTKFPEMDD